MKRLAQMLGQVSFNQKITIAGLFVAILALASLFTGLWLSRASPLEYWEAFSTNAGTELLSIAITVLVLNVLYKRADDERLKKQLIREMGSSDNGFALRAIDELSAKGWLFDGSLAGARLGGANLQSADLLNANLEGAELWNANLRNSKLRDANLKSANLQRADLRGARLVEANLENANLSEARLTDAVLLDARLRGAIFRGTEFINSDLRGADLRDAAISQSEFHNAKYSGRTSWPDGFSPDWIYIPDDEGNA